MEHRSKLYKDICREGGEVLALFFAGPFLLFRRFKHNKRKRGLCVSAQHTYTQSACVCEYKSRKAIREKPASKGIVNFGLFSYGGEAQKQKNLNKEIDIDT